MSTWKRSMRRTARRVARLREPQGRTAAKRRARYTARVVKARVTGAPRPAPPARRTPAKKAAAPAKKVAAAVDRGFVGGWSRLATQVQGSHVPAVVTTFEPELSSALARQAAGQRVRSLLVEAIERGESLERATYAAVSGLTTIKDWNGALALVEGLARLPGGDRAALVGHAVVWHRRRLLPQLWQTAQQLTDDELAQVLPVEAVEGALADGSPAALERAHAVADQVSSFDETTLIRLAGRFLAVGERARAGTLLATSRTRSGPALDERDDRTRVLCEGWLAQPTVDVPAGAAPVAIIDYQSPDQVQASGNGGDYVQSLALLGNLARLQNVTFTGQDGLGELVTELKGRVRPELRDAGATGALHLFAVERDFSSGMAVPPTTWMIAFGWQMHPLFDIRYDFPYHPNIRPVFVSFHINRLAMLTPEALDYLRTYGPVGCRDWTTVYLLLSAGVDAFFTGCLTTTVGGVFPDRDVAYSGHGVPAVVDLPRAAAGPGAKNVRSFTHQDDKYRHMHLVDGVRAAIELLTEYQTDVARAVTRRLHAYLPMVSLGVPVEFTPWSSGDVRFPGLDHLGSDPAAMAAVQDGIRELVDGVLAAVASGAAEDEVYDLWRRLTADRVAEAKARFTAPVVDPAPVSGVDELVATSWAGAQRHGPHDGVDPAAVTDVVLCFDANLLDQAAVTVESILANATGAVRLWVLGRGLPTGYPAWLAGAFPDLPLTVLPCDHIDLGVIERIPDRITISTMDRLLLPHLLPDVDRIVYLDVDIMVVGDIVELASTDLGDSAVAARASNISAAAEWRAAARRLPGPVSLELQRRMGLLHGYGDPALNAGVLVLDLARMRADGFTAAHLALVAEYGWHDQDVMLAYGGPGRAVLDPAWNALPVLENPQNPRVVHWASIGKPWEQRLTYDADRWRGYAAAVRERAGPAPTE